MRRLSRVLFLAVDAGDPDLITAWADEGRLPAFRALRESAAWGPTSNPPGLFVGAIWPSFWTGLSPARHGRYCYSQLRTGTYEQYHVTPHDTGGVPFWDVLSDAGCRVAILDVPKTVPSPRVRGIQMVDWGTHDPELGFATFPASFAAEIEARVGRHPIGQCDGYLERGAGGLGELRDGLVRGVEKKRELAAHLLERGDWDLFLTVFAESHCVGHQCWHVHDPAHPRHDPEQARVLGDPVRDVYAAIDSAVGDLISRASPDTTVIVLASHGMGPHYDGTYLLDEILRRLFPKTDAPPAKRRFARLAESVWHGLPAGLRRTLRPIRSRVKGGLGGAVTVPDLDTTFCFSTPNNDVYGGIRVNLAGREPRGRVQPGPDYEAFCETLSRDLLSLVNLATGKPLVRRVLRTADHYRGNRLADLPDLLVEWDRDAPINRIQSPKTGLIEGAFPGRRTGDHKAEGLFFARGPGIVPGRIAAPVSVMQFAATIGALLGVRLEDTDGEPIPEIAAAAGDSTVDPAPASVQPAPESPDRC